MAELDRKVQATLDFLIANHPVFSERKPLAIGTREALRERHPGIDFGLLRSALLKHCKRPRYLKALASNPQRYDLEGNAVGTVTAAERDKAIRELQAHHEREQAQMQRRLEYARRELEAVRRKAERLKAREARLLSARQKKAAKRSRPQFGYRAEPMVTQRPPEYAPVAAARRPVVVTKRRSRNPGFDPGNA